WKGVFFGAKKNVLLRQNYFGLPDIKNHVDYMQVFWKDDRYEKREGRPVFHIYNPKGIPQCRNYIEMYRNYAKMLGWPDLWVVGEGIDISQKERYSLDGVVYSRHRAVEYSGAANKALKALNLFKTRTLPGLKVYDYEYASRFFLKTDRVEMYEYPSLVPNWDTTPRLGKDAVVLHGSTPDKFGESCREIFSAVAKKPKKDRIVYLKSWNEWAEGNYIEPCWRFQDSYLKILKEIKNNYE
ncbi:glycoside hydrolase family 99-like domain-containing protein, partial [Schleiferiaceae bacterium]|nr:glycoside hydrolase family 99-like domain-containing protein [Schleiferiaceae bacterium]